MEYVSERVRKLAKDMGGSELAQRGVDVRYDGKKMYIEAGADQVADDLCSALGEVGTDVEIREDIRIVSVKDGKTLLRVRSERDRGSETSVVCPEPAKLKLYDDEGRQIGETDTAEFLEGYHYNLTKRPK